MTNFLERMERVDYFSGLCTLWHGLFALIPGISVRPSSSFFL